MNKQIDYKTIGKYAAAFAAGTVLSALLIPSCQGNRPQGYKSISYQGAPVTQNSQYQISGNGTLDVLLNEKNGIVSISTTLNPCPELKPAKSNPEPTTIKPKLPVNKAPTSKTGKTKPAGKPAVSDDGWTNDEYKVLPGKTD